MLRFDGDGFDLTPNATAPLAAWAPALQRRAWFQKKGDGPDAFDCWGLVAHVQALLGRPVRSYAAAYGLADFSRAGGLDRLIRAEAETWRAGAGEVGDVLVCARANAVTHVAVLCGAGSALHVLETAGVLCTFLGARRVKRLLNMKVVGCVRPA